MRATTFILVLVASVALVHPAAGAAMPGWGTLQRLRRALLQTPPPLFEPPATQQTSGTTPQCSYYSAVPLNNGLCVLAPEFLLSIVTPPPDSYIANTLTAVHARRRHCSQQRNTSACYSYQASHSCYWAVSPGVPLPRNTTATGASCQTADFDAWVSFKNNPILSQAPLWAWCPNTDAWRYMRCSARTAASSGACGALSGCVWDAPGRACRPSFLMAKDTQQRQRWMDVDFGTLTPSAAGSCEGACWLRQLLEEAGGANGQPFANILGTSNWSDFIGKAQSECRNEGYLDAATCAAAGYPSTGIVISKLETYSQWGPLSGAADGGC